MYPLSPHAFDIDCLRWRSITPAGAVFSPTANLTRWEMASWLDTTLRWVQPRYGGQPETFIDTPGLPGAESIEALRQVGVTKGVTSNRFDPYGAVPRWQMALFLTRTILASGAVLPPPSSTAFADLAGTTPEARVAIEQLAATGITRGTGPSTFSPNTAVTREQMASFVARTLEYIWVVDLSVTDCEAGSSPMVCAGQRSVPRGGVPLRVSLVMADHIGSLTGAAAIISDPTTNVVILIDGTPVPVFRSERRHPGAIYGYWEATLGDVGPGEVEVEARIHLRSVHVNTRIVTVTVE